MDWSERLAHRVWHLTTLDGEGIGSVTRYVEGEGGWQAWLRGPDPMGTVVGRGFASPDAAKKAVERAPVERLAKGPGVSHEEPPPNR